MEILSLPLEQIQKKLSTLPASDTALVSDITRAVEKKKTFELLNRFEKRGILTKFLDHYIPYQFSSITDLMELLTAQKKKLPLISLLIVSNLFYAANSKERPYDFEKHFQLQTGPEITIPEPTTPDSEFIISMLEQCKTEKATLTNEQFAETLMVPAGKFKNRLFSFSRTPYSRKIHYWMSPESECRVLANMWGVQIGKSTALENTAVYYSKIVPKDIMVAVADEDAAAQVSKKRYLPRAGVAKVRFVAEKWGDKQKRDTGNSLHDKEFAGGSIRFISVNSPNKTASVSIAVMLCDEIDRWGKKQSRGNEGAIVPQLKARTASYGSRAKELYVSSPNLVHFSEIYQMFLQGTQHHYHIVCPVCKNRYPLEFGYDREYGLQYSLKNGKVDPESVYYVCPHHGDNPDETDLVWIAKNPGKHRWYDYQKQWAMATENGADWIAHAEPEIPNHVSTTLSSLYSPMLQWLDIAYLHRQMVILNPEQEQSFVNQYLGLPYEPKGTRPDITKINVLRDESYQMGTVPDGVLYLTAAVDVQRGSKGEKKKTNPARLELQILGICNDFSTKLIDYMQIEGETDSADAGAWAELDRLYESEHFTYTRHRDGLIFEPVFWLFDAKDGSRTNTVYTYCRLQGNRMMYPSMGEQYVAKDRTIEDDTLDKASSKSYLPYKKREDKQTGITVYHISTTHYKKNIYHNLERSIQRAGELGTHIGKMSYPKDTPDKFFDMLFAEEMRPDGSFWCPAGRRNEALDTTVYCLAGADIWLNLYRDSLKTKAKSAGQKDITYIDYQFCKDRIAIQSGQLWATEEFAKHHNALSRRS